MVAIRLLGPVGVAGPGDAEVSLGGPQPRAVLALLAWAAPRACTSQQIIDGLWGEVPPASARNAVQVNVTRLRKALTTYDVGIERSGDGYALRGSFRVDASDFDTLVSEGRAALRSGDHSRSRDRLTAGLELWQGHPLDGLDDAPFAESARAVLEQTRGAALADLAHARLRTGDPQGAVSTAQVLLALQPYDERGWMVLATAYYWSGQQDLALETCRRARSLLLEELGVDPTAALTQLERQILRHEVPGIEPPSGESEMSSPTLSLPALPVPFVGRADLLAELADRVRRGQRLVTLVGIGGIGKTSLATCLAHELAGAGTKVTFCALDTDTDVRSALDRLCRTFGLEASEDPAAALAQSAVCGVVVLDNVEQITGFGLALDDLLRACPELSAVVTSRRPIGARLERALAVPPLPPADAQTVFLAHAERVRPGIGAGQQAPIRSLCALLDGIPLALELAAGRVRSLTPGQLLGRIQDRRASVLDGSAAVAVPERQASLNGVLQDSYAALAPPGRGLFELLGSFEGWVSIDLLERASEGLVPDFFEALDELVACGLVSLDLDGRARVQGPIREFARGLGFRPALDARVVQHAVSLALDVAPHLFGATTPGALAQLRQDEDTLTVALTRAVEAGDAHSAGALALSLNRFWLLTGRLAEGKHWIELVAQLNDHRADTASRLAVLAGTYASYLNDPTSIDQLTRALAQTAASGLAIDRLIVNGWCCLAAYAAHHGDVDTANSASAEAARLAQTTGDATLTALARDVDGHVAAYQGDHDRSLAANLEGLADARRTGDLYDAVHLMANAVAALVYLDRTDEAVVYADEAFDLTATLEVGPLLGFVLLTRGTALAAAGRFTAARGNLLEALRIARDRYPDPLATADVLYTLGACSTEELADADAARCYSAAEALYASHGLDARARVAATLVRTNQVLRDRLGEKQYTTLGTLGSADPERTITLLLADQAGHVGPA